jgi:integrase
MNTRSTVIVGEGVTLGDVIKRIDANPDLSPSRRRDCRSALSTYAKLIGREPSTIALDLAEIRNTLDRMVPAAAQVSRKRWANLRSDIAAAIKASGLRPLLSTAKLEPDGTWASLLASMNNERWSAGLSRFARWASLRRIPPDKVDDAVIALFVAELEAASLVRKIGDQHRMVTRVWNALVASRPDLKLRPVQLVVRRPAPRRVSWDALPASFRADLDEYLTWCAVPDPLDEDARARRLAPKTISLRRDEMNGAVTAAVAAGIDPGRLTFLANLVEVETFRALLKQRWEKDGRKLTAYTHGVAGSLVAIAREWVKAPAEHIATLKALRHKLGGLPVGLTEKNQALLRKFDDPRLLAVLLELPDRLWRRARREFATRPRKSFLDLQTTLAIDLLLHVPLRMENLTSLSFERHLHWPRGRGKPAQLVIGGEETKNRLRLEFEIAAPLADRLLALRDEIAPKVVGHRPDGVFVHPTGEPRTQATIAVSIGKAVLRHTGLRITPHQFRHLAAKIILDAHPGAIELVRQMLGQKHLKTTINYYAGIDTRRAGRAHNELIRKLREASLRPRRRPHRPRENEPEDEE